jgi:hypothetical protein
MPARVAAACLDGAGALEFAPAAFWSPIGRGYGRGFYAEEGRHEPCLPDLGGSDLSTGEIAGQSRFTATNEKKPRRRKTGGTSRGFSVLMGGPVMAEGLPSLAGVIAPEDMVTTL